jgi:molybdate transport system substrate-binding protein
MRMTRRCWLGVINAVLLGAALTFAPSPPAAAQSRDVLVFAAASLKNALDEIAADWQRQSGKKAVISYAGSNNLIRQIEQGAPADMFISADTDWMDYGERRKLIQPQTRADLLGNRLVLVAPKDATLRIAVQPGLNLASALNGGRLAIANVDAVPAGKYGKAALEKLGAWDPVKDHLAPTENVRNALLLVARGEAPLGIVYETDAVSEPAVRIVGTFPDDSHPPIVYPIALMATSRNPDAAAFLAFIRSPAARPAFERQGFTVLGAGAKRS